MRWLIWMSVFILLPMASMVQAKPTPGTWKAGVAVRVITPRQPMWMAGYAARKKPAEGKLHDLYVKALALEDPAGKRLVLLTSDLVAIPRHLAEAVASAVKQRTGLSRSRIMLTVSHTHCAPVLEDDLRSMYDMPVELAKRIPPYTNKVRDWMIEAIVDALGDLQPAKLAIGQGTARFAVNRRKRYNPDGPVDHDVPVLRVTGEDGKLRAVVFGYACHNTTLSFYQWCGDYAGFAQIALEKKHPGAKAFFWSGCGGDANPLPRRKVSLCQKYGNELAAAVEGVLKGKMKPLTSASEAHFTEVALPFAKIPDRAQLTAELLSKRYAQRQRAEKLLALLNSRRKIDDHYRHYPVQVWRFGDQLVWISLGGEVVVDYSLRLKKELKGDRAVWVTAYANNVMAYIGSARVIKEGGYEGDTSMVYYGQPSRWSTAVEEIIIKKVHELVNKEEKKNPRE